MNWDQNTANLVKNANARMQLLRKIATFGTNHDELKDIYVLFIRSLLEQSATVWHSSLTEENRNDLERIQKTAVKIILGDRYRNYEQALLEIDLENLDDRRTSLCLTFAKKCCRNPQTSNMFPKNVKMHNMDTRKQELYKVQHAKTERLQKSSIIFMQNLLNDLQN